jgi:hypothetical protein
MPIRESRGFSPQCKKSRSKSSSGKWVCQYDLGSLVMHQHASFGSVCAQSVTLVTFSLVSFFPLFSSGVVVWGPIVVRVLSLSQWQGLRMARMTMGHTLTSCWLVFFPVHTECSFMVSVFKRECQVDMRRLHV